jgi:hypothetical protein
MIRFSEPQGIDRRDEMGSMDKEHKMRNPYKFLPLAVMIIISMGFFIGCGMEEIYSKWCDHVVTIGGIDGGAEWENARHAMDDGNITVGLLNDEKTLFLRLSTRNQAIQRQILAAGLTVWFDGEGGKKKIYGIHFPASGQGSGRSPMLKGDRDQRDDPDEMSGKLREVAQGELKITGPEQNERSYIAAEDSTQYGLQYSFGYAKGDLVYELGIPLTRNNSTPYGIAVREASIIGIGLEPGKIERSQETTGGGRSGKRGSHRGADQGGASGGQKDGRGGMADSQEPMKPIDQWLKVHLAVKP